MEFYELLGVRKSAAAAEIRRAYQKLARRLHPDLNPGDPVSAERFRAATRAFEVLSDAQRRAAYDRGERPAPPPPPVSAFGFEGFDFSISVHGHQSTTFGDLFSEVFERRHAAGSDGQSERGTDIHLNERLTFDESRHGTERAVTVTRRERCRECEGLGSRSAAESPCLRCEGTGSSRAARGHMVFSRPCVDCGGTGLRRASGCPSCAGSGLETHSEIVRVRIPPGVGDGSRVRIAGKGNSGMRGGEPGDLLITMHVSPHQLFRRDGDDLHVTVPVAIHEAALGARIDVPTPDGPARLRVPPGSQSGQRFHLRSRGMPSIGDGRRGDLVVEIQLVLPKTLDERSKELLREFGRLNEGDVRREPDGSPASPRDSRTTS